MRDLEELSEGWEGVQKKVNGFDLKVGGEMKYAEGKVMALPRPSQYLAGYTPRAVGDTGDDPQRPGNSKAGCEACVNIRYTTSDTHPGLL